MSYILSYDIVIVDKQQSSSSCLPRPRPAPKTPPIQTLWDMRSEGVTPLVVNGGIWGAKRFFSTETWDFSQSIKFMDSYQDLKRCFERMTDCSFKARKESWRVSIERVSRMNAINRKYKTCLTLIHHDQIVQNDNGFQQRLLLNRVMSENLMYKHSVRADDQVYYSFLSDNKEHKNIKMRHKTHKNTRKALTVRRNLQP